MMKTIINKLTRDEGGQAFILVLIFLLVGGLILTPLLGYMSTGVRAGQMYEEKMEGLYAADAGIEDALYKIMKNDASLPWNLGGNWTYPLPEVINGNNVTVEILLEEDVNQFLIELLGADAGVHEEWTIIVDNDVVPGEYTITITYDGAAVNKKIYGVGAWFRGTDWVCTDDSAGESATPPLTDMNDDYPAYTFTTQNNYKGGTVFKWQWAAASRPVFNPSTTRTQTFRYTPLEVPALALAWVYVGSSDIGAVPTSVTFGTYKVTATATDSATGEQTVVIAYPSWQDSGGLNAVDILAWDNNP
jgi:hypothetical protein